ncbi:NUDIX hydrolase [Methanobacterium sp.]|uniref:NUDIX hydrolase n=1 Tax=Methanobacterium sp. TaxID=2164 RepID=UPI003C73360A
MIEYVFGLAVRVLLTDEKGKILIIKRSTGSKTNPGKWELPGGKVDSGESFDQALVREVYEETNLKIKLDHVVGVCEQNLPLIRAIHIVMSGKIVDGYLNLSNEHEGYAWVFFEDLHDYELADWLNDFVINQNRTYNDYNEENKDKTSNNITSTKEALKPWINPIKASMDKMLGKK